MSARQRLAEAQEELVRALVLGGPVPEGFDRQRVARCARSLVGKRRREVARAWPALATCLGDGYRPQFEAFAKEVPPPSEGGPAADGRAFARTVPWARLDDAARLALLAYDAAHGWLPGACWLSGGVALALPGLGVFRWAR
jgi:hypothetical protein